MADEKKTIKERIERAVITEDAAAAYDLAQEVENRLAQVDPSDLALLESLERVRAQLMAVAMRYYSSQALQQLFEQHVTDILRLPNDIDLTELIKSRLLSESLAEDKDALKEKIRKSIERSQNEIGRTKIVIGSDEVKPSVENWIRLLISETGIGRASSVQVARFFAQNTNVTKLSDYDQLLLRRLVRLYQSLKISSDTVEGLDTTHLLKDEKDGLLFVDDQGSRKVMTDDVMKSLQQKAANRELDPVELAELRTEYPGRFVAYQPSPILEGAAVDISPEQIQQRSAEFFSRQQEQFQDAGQNPVQQTDLSAAVLSLLGINEKATIGEVKDKLAKIFSEKESLSAFLAEKSVKDLVLREFPAEIGEKSKAVIEKTSFHPVALQAFLQILFEKALELPRKEALWHSYTVLRHLPMLLKEFKTIVTYDVSKNSLVWRH